MTVPGNPPVYYFDTWRDEMPYPKGTIVRDATVDGALFLCATACSGIAPPGNDGEWIELSLDLESLGLDASADLLTALMIDLARCKLALRFLGADPDLFPVELDVLTFGGF